jgi:Fe-S-cluster containining protein
LKRSELKIVLSFKYPKRLRFVCERCAICCGDTEERNRSVLLLQIEAQRISKKILKQVGDFAEKVGGSEPYVYRIKKNGDGRCVFLRDNSCSIYEMRPLICKFYPFQLTSSENDKLVFDYTSECPSIGKGPELGISFFKKLYEESLRLMQEDAVK